MFFLNFSLSLAFNSAYALLNRQHLNETLFMLTILCLCLRLDLLFFSFYYFHFYYNQLYHLNKTDTIVFLHISLSSGKKCSSRVLLSFCLIFLPISAWFAYKSVAYKKASTMYVRCIFLHGFWLLILQMSCQSFFLVYISLFCILKNIEVKESVDAKRKNPKVRNSLY